jgi:hypothetical protein
MLVTCRVSNSSHIILVRGCYKFVEFVRCVIVYLCINAHILVSCNTWVQLWKLRWQDFSFLPMLFDDSRGSFLFCCRSVTLFSGGGMLALLLFTTIERYSHGFYVWHWDYAHCWSFYSSYAWFLWLWNLFHISIMVLNCCRVTVLDIGEW